ncbi:MAG: tRNA-dihydrouridine synthase [Chitinivibrionales bacterium]|nr:tRNA-dihydrouridine synthase [Chitinivibrionales bacterium]
MHNFWSRLESPIFTLAPMEDVTDTSFREVILSASAPECLHAVFTEFTSTDGLYSEKGRANVKRRLAVNDSERKLLQKMGVRLVAQIWGANPVKFHWATRWICDNFEFDGIDINMGCPVKKIVKGGGCSALIKDFALAREIIAATKNATDLPVSVKTRIGFNSVVTEEWSENLLSTGLAALIVHGRTQRMQSEGRADWNEVAKTAAIRTSMGLQTKILGNGDVGSYAQGVDYTKRYGLDGVMIGRGVFKNPWFFAQHDSERSLDEKLTLIRSHIRLFDQTWGEVKKFEMLKRFFKIYLTGFKGAAALRGQLMETKTAQEALSLLSNPAPTRSL